MPKPRLAVFKLASCDGCQLTLLDAEDELLAIAGEVEVAHFLEASSRVEPGPYDVGLVEGSVTTPCDAERVRQIRRECKYLVAIGACATAGGIQALRNWGDVAEFARAVYASPEYIATLATSTPVSDHVAVDFELRGCPVNKSQLLDLITSALIGRRPKVARHSVCVECKRRGTVCVAVAQGLACLGPVTQAGCGAICPSFDRGCYGCFGPQELPNLVSLAGHLQSRGEAPAHLARLARSFNGYAPGFREVGDALEARDREATTDGR
jgi:coenzyme F420-reducing hydrogenase gamma subunit